MDVKRSLLKHKGDKMLKKIELSLKCIKAWLKFLTKYLKCNSSLYYILIIKLFRWICQTHAFIVPFIFKQKVFNIGEKAYMVIY